MGKFHKETKIPDAKLPRKQGEYPKVSERTMVKELGKMTP